MSDLPSTEVKGLAARVGAVATRADRGDERALRTIRRLLDGCPELWEMWGDVAAAAEDALIDLHAGKSALTREGLRRRLRDMRASLAGPSASPLEHLLVQRVVVCWLHSYEADLAYARALRDVPPQLVELYHRRQDRAARQYLKAIRSLADVRRLLIPVLQLNVAENQVNVAVAAPAARPGRPAADSRRDSPAATRTPTLRPPRRREPA